MALDRRIFVLALATFAMGTEAYVYVGHLEQLAADFGQTVAIAGQIATIFAVTYALSAPLIADYAARFNRRTVLVTGLVLIGVINCLAALSPNLAVLMGLRFAAGMAAGLVGPIASLAAAELATPETRGKAMAIVLSGMTLAFILGIPTGSFLGDFYSWRGTFVYAGLIALLAATIMRLVLPDMNGGRGAGISAFKAVLQPAIVQNLAMTLIGFAATFVSVAYFGPVITGITGLAGSGIGAMQALIGVGSIVGIAIGAISADMPISTRVLTVSFVVSALSMALYSLLMLTASVEATQLFTSGFGAAVLGLASIGTIAGAAALFARTPVIQVRLVNASTPDVRPVALALNGSMVLLGQGLGAGIGGIAIATLGLPHVGFAGAVLALLGLTLDTKSQKVEPVL
jgi:MFS transporter, DHA1 family, inner membrane transport protein